MGSAVARAASPARLALAARDLERDDHAVAGGHRRHRGPDLDHLGDAFVAERVRSGQRVSPAEHSDVEVAHRHGERSDDRGAVRIGGVERGFVRRSPPGDSR